jgi:hypothetical protein
VEAAEPGGHVEKSLGARPGQELVTVQAPGQGDRWGKL